MWWNIKHNSFAYIYIYLLSPQEVTIVETVEPMGRMKRSRPDSAEPKTDDEEEDGDDDSDAFGMQILRAWSW